uniref:Uncharacterized protein n=1 Tax=Schizopora paradoxa TaxID=27342 RepID=A0A5B9R9W3_9AGAM|nr:hypothetical protein Schpa_000049 [Schizopora paradoxa]QEG57228.1 hypothetical protein Schpa_000049 [Schizopora paradoxa]
MYTLDAILIKIKTMRLFNYIGNLRSLSFLGRNLYLILGAFLLSGNYIILPYLKQHYPFIYNKFIEFIDMTSPYVAISLVYWYILMALFFLMELILFLIICSTNEKIVIHKKWPSFLHRYLNEMYEDSQINNTIREDMTKYYIRRFIIHAVISLIAVLLYIIFI